MNSFALVFAAFLAVSQAAVITHSVVTPFARSTLLQGPSTSTHVVGPDGSQIVANAPGAHVDTAAHVAQVAAVAPVAPVAPIAPVVAAPVVAAAAAYAAPAAYAAHTAYAAPFVAAPYAHAGFLPYAAGSGIEGQYVHDYTESLYDDGSYKGEFY